MASHSGSRRALRRHLTVHVPQQANVWRAVRCTLFCVAQFLRQVAAPRYRVSQTLVIVIGEVTA